MSPSAAKDLEKRATELRGKGIALCRVARVQFRSARCWNAFASHFPDKATDRAMRAGLRGPKWDVSVADVKKGNSGASAGQ
jgi:hypothetical protein